MPDFEQKPNTGNAWINDYKKADNHPDFKGKFTDLHGDLKELALWKRKDKNGKTYVYFSIGDQYVKDMEERGDDSAKSEVRLDDDEPINLSDIPF